MRDRFERVERRRRIEFLNEEGVKTGHVDIVETNVNPRGNKHYTARRPDGPVCECGALWKPVCPNPSCGGGRVPKAMERVERGEGKKIFGEGKFGGRDITSRAARALRTSRDSDEALQDLLERRRKQKDRPAPSKHQAPPAELIDADAARDLLATRFTVRPVNQRERGREAA